VSRAVRVHGWGTTPTVVDVDAPTRATGESLVRVRAATVSHLDRTIWSGSFLHPPPLPYTPGVEGAGEVIESDTLAAGQRVWMRGAGLGTARDGTWAEVVSAPDAALGPLPDTVPDELGAAFFSPCTSAWVALHHVAGLGEGDRVLVTGANGAVGSIAVQLAAEAGAEVHATSTRAVAVPDGVRAHVGEPGTEVEVDVVVDTVGGPVLEACLPRVARGGRVVLVGYVGGTTVSLDVAALIQRDTSLLPLNMIAREGQGRAAVPELLERLGDGRLSLATTSFPLDDVAAALAWLGERGRTGRAVVRP
jgi:NADPH2:quinone reductase